MKYFLLFLTTFISCHAFYDYEHKPLSELKQIDAEVYYDDCFGIFIKYKDHWYDVSDSVHHTLCPCYLNERYHKSLSQELSGY
jgi:hypothetical protein